MMRQAGIDTGRATRLGVASKETRSRTVKRTPVLTPGGGGIVHGLTVDLNDNTEYVTIASALASHYLCAHTVEKDANMMKYVGRSALGSLAGRNNWTLIYTRALLALFCHMVIWYCTPELGLDNPSKESNQYFGGDSTMFEGKDD